MSPLTQSIFDSFISEGAKWAYLIISIAGVLGGQAELLPEPYRHYVTIFFTITTAIAGVLIKLQPAPQMSSVTIPPPTAKGK